MRSEKLVVGVAGMAGAGKSVVVKSAMHLGFEAVTMGDVVRKEARERNVEPSPEILGRIMLELRKAFGEAIIAKKCVSTIEKAKARKIVVDGMRSLAEVDEFKRSFPGFRLLAVHASPETRFIRLYSRQRSDDPTNRAVFEERDKRELGVGLGNVIAMAEYVIVNEGEIGQSRRRAEAVLRRIERQWMRY